MTSRTPYQTDVSDEEWALVAPYLALLPEDVSQRSYALREVFNAVRYIVRTGAPWRLMPHDLPPWLARLPQMRRWLAAGSFAAIVQDLRMLLRRAAERPRPPTRRDPGCAYDAVDPRERSAGRLGRTEAAQGLHSACGGGYARSSAGAARDLGQ